MKIVDVIFYTTDSGKQPFVVWQKELAIKTEAIVLARLARIRGGNFGDCKPIRGVQGIYELRINYGAGYRIYYGRQGATVVVLLIGGDKGSQSRDIARAKKFWLDFKEKNDD
jgi:putative addiction module killer protein